MTALMLIQYRMRFAPLAKTPLTNHGMLLVNILKPARLALFFFLNDAAPPEIPPFPPPPPLPLPPGAVARDSAQAGPGSRDPPVGDRPARAAPGGRRGGGRARRGRNRRRQLPHARGGDRGAGRVTRGEHRGAARSGAA